MFEIDFLRIRNTAKKPARNRLRFCQGGHSHFLAGKATSAACGIGGLASRGGPAVVKKRKKVAFLTHFYYRKVMSSNTSRLEAHKGFFRLLMKGIFDPYVP